MNIFKLNIFNLLIVFFFCFSQNANSEEIFNNENSEKLSGKAPKTDLIVKFAGNYNINNIRTYHFPIKFSKDKISSIKLINVKSGNVILIKLKYYNIHYLKNIEDIIVEEGEYRIVHTDNDSWANNSSSKFSGMIQIEGTLLKKSRKGEVTLPGEDKTKPSRKGEVEIKKK